MIARAIRAGLFAAAAILGLAAAAGGASAQEETRLPVPSVTIYPRDVIREDMLEDRDFASKLVGQGVYVESRRALVGKASRMTLLAGRPIPAGSIEDVKLVTIGGQVRIVFRQNGVTIVAFGAALQAGAAGELVRVRNQDSGLTVSGVVQSDGSVSVGDS